MNITGPENEALLFFLFSFGFSSEWSVSSARSSSPPPDGEGKSVDIIVARSNTEGGTEPILEVWTKTKLGEGICRDSIKKF